MPATHTLEGDLYVPYYAHEAYETSIGDVNVIDFLDKLHTNGRKVKLTIEILPEETDRYE